jgi:hypothetical protein
MKPIMIAIGTLIAIAALITAINRLTDQLRQPSDLDYARASAEIARLSRERDSEETWAPIRAAAFNVAAIIFVLSMATCASAWAVAGVIRFRHERMPNHAGLLPVRAVDLALVAPQALGAFHATAQIAASRQPVPTTVTYSPHTALNNRVDAAGIPALPVSEPAASLPGLTDLATLGHTPTADSILLALGEGGERITVSARALCHVALVGATGGGKSNLLRLLLPQLQAIGARVVLADPHYAPIDPENGDDWRAIEARLHLAPAVKASEIAALFAYLTDELDRRIELRNKGQKWGPSLFLAMDELPVIADSVEGAIDQLGRLLREGRKVGIFSVGASQSMLVKVVGGDSSAREAYRTAFYVGGDLKSAAALLDMPQREINEGKLTTGMALLRSVATAPARLVRVPYASNRAIAALLGPPSPGTVAGTADRPFGFRAGTPVPASVPASVPARVTVVDSRYSASECVTTATETATVPDAEEARILARFANGASLHDIAIEIGGNQNPGSRQYRAARARIEQLLRSLAARQI